MSELFRREAISAAEDHFSRPVAPLGIPTRVVTALLVTIFAVACLFLATGTYARKETVAGRVVSEAFTSEIYVPRQGVVDTVVVQEGQFVRARDVIATLKTDETLRTGSRLAEEVIESLGDQVRAVADESTADLERLESQRRQSAGRASSLERKRRMLMDEQGLEVRRVELAQVTVTDLRPMFERRQISALQYRQYELALLDAQRASASLARQIREVGDEIRALGVSEVTLLAEIRAMKARQSNTRASLDQRRLTLESQQAHALISPVDGVVAALSLRPGDTVAPGQARVIIAPVDAAIRAELWVPSRSIGFVEVGKHVRLMYDAFPYQRFGFGQGYVESVSQAPFPAGQSFGGGAPFKEPMFRVLVSVVDSEVSAYGEKRRLLPGMTLSADMVLERRTFMQWLFDPIRAARLRAQG